jgi:hypothetical protein
LEQNTKKQVRDIKLKYVIYATIVCNYAEETYKIKAGGNTLEVDETNTSDSNVLGTAFDVSDKYVFSVDSNNAG